MFNNVLDIRLFIGIFWAMNVIGLDFLCCKFGFWILMLVGFMGIFIVIKIFK